MKFIKAMSLIAMMVAIQSAHAGLDPKPCKFADQSKITGMSEAASKKVVDRSFPQAAEKKEIKTKTNVNGDAATT